MNKIEKTFVLVSSYFTFRYVGIRLCFILHACHFDLLTLTVVTATILMDRHERKECSVTSRVIVLLLHACSFFAFFIGTVGRYSTECIPLKLYVHNQYLCL